MSVSGATNTVLESVVPYSKISMIQLLDKIPSQYCSQQTSYRALKLSLPGRPVLGIGFTGSFASSYPKHRDHRFHLSTRTCDTSWVSTVTLAKGLRTREQEGTISSHFLLKAIADACKVPRTYVLELNESNVVDESEKKFHFT